MSDRRLILLAAVSMVLALVVCLPIPLSYESDAVSLRRGRLGGFRLAWWTAPAATTTLTVSRQFLYLITYDRRLETLGPRTGQVRHDLRCSNAILIPPLFLFPAWAVVRLLREIREDSRRLKGLCPGCGYDLRASADRCPECGRVVATRPQSQPPG